MTPDPSRVRTLQLEEAVLAAQMRAAQAGDQRAYAGLLWHVTPWLRQYVRKQRRFLQPTDVEDLVQEVLLSIHAVRQTYDPGRPFLPWLLAITHNRLADAARRHARRSTHETPWDGPEGRDGDHDVTSWDESANTGESSVGDPQALHRAIRALPAGQRAAIELLKLRQMSLKEAAEALGTTVGALKVSVHRAMASLKRSLAGR